MYTAEQWYPKTALAELLGVPVERVDDNRLYRALDELLPVLLHLLSHPDLAGPVNLAAPGAVSNAEFTAELARELHRPALAVVPPFVLEAAFGEMAQEMLLKGARVVPAKLLASGYEFRFPGLREALRAILNK